MAQLDRLFHAVCDRKASDLHLTSGAPPMARIHGKIQPLLPDHPRLDPRTLEALLLEIAPEENRREYLETKDTDFAYELAGRARFRANLFRDRAGPGGVFRQIPKEIVPAEKLGLPRSVLDLCWLSKGLVVVTGPTGSGKSTTLCAMVDYMNRNRDEHILTIEDPIEFIHENKRCLVNQREVGTHTDGFARALRAALREDPNVVVVGEMRDLETISIALEMAETGHLVLGTLHTTTAASTVDRIVDSFPHERQQQVRTMLSESLRGVVAQTLLRKKDGSGRVAALEVLIANAGVAAHIREGKTHQIQMALQTGRKAGMKDLNTALLELVTADAVAPEEAWAKAIDKGGLARELERLGIAFKPPGEEPAAETPAPAPAPPAPKPPAPSGPGQAAGGIGIVRRSRISGGLKRPPVPATTPGAPAAAPEPKKSWWGA